MDIKRWSWLPRSFYISPRHNRSILVLTAVGSVWGFIIGHRSAWPGMLQAAVAAAIVFLAGALAKKVDPDKPTASLLVRGVMGGSSWHPGLSSGILPLPVFGRITLIYAFNYSTGASY